MPESNPAVRVDDSTLLQLTDPTPEQAALMARLLAELTYALVRARTLDIIVRRSDVARAEAAVDPRGRAAAQRVVDEVRERVLDDSTSYHYFLTKLAERVEQVPNELAT